MAAVCWGAVTMPDVGRHQKPSDVFTHSSSSSQSSTRDSNSSILGYVPGDMLRSVAYLAMPPPVVLSRDSASMPSKLSPACAMSYSEEPYKFSIDEQWSRFSGVGGNAPWLEAAWSNTSVGSSSPVTAGSTQEAGSDDFERTCTYDVVTESAPQQPQQHGPRPKTWSPPVITNGVTTLMVRNLPQALTQTSLMSELDSDGFAGKYDFCYVPSLFHTGKGKSYAFVNFISSTVAKAFAKQWHQSRRFESTESGSLLNIAVAEIQGTVQNLSKMQMSKRSRIRNPRYRPFVAEKLFEDASEQHRPHCTA